jgi:hypothetical protein
MSAIECICKCFESNPGWFVTGLFFVCLFVCIAISSVFDSLASMFVNYEHETEDDDDEEEEEEKKTMTTMRNS